MEDEPLVRRGLMEEASLALQIWHEAVAWLATKGCPLWNAEEFDLQMVQNHANAGELILGFTGDISCASMLIQSADPFFWPDKEEGSALYLHKLAVRRAYAGRGWGRVMIEWAAQRGKTLGVPLRLDCDPRPALMNLYLANGFLPVDGGPVERGGCTVMRYERY